MNTKPTLRLEAHLNLKSTLERVFKESFPFQSCINCLHFNEKEEICKLYKARPPARVIVFGCSSYADVDEVPF